MEMSATEVLKKLVCFGVLLIVAVSGCSSVFEDESSIEVVDGSVGPYWPANPDLQFRPDFVPEQPLFIEIPTSEPLLIGSPFIEPSAFVQLTNPCNVPIATPQPVGFSTPVTTLVEPVPVSLPIIESQTLLAGNAVSQEELYCTWGEGELLGASPMPCSHPATPFNSTEGDPQEEFEAIPLANIPIVHPTHY